MKKIIYLGIYLFLFSQISALKAQNLEFNSAVFYTYSGLGDGGFSASQVNVGTVIVGANQIFKITSAQAHTLPSSSYVPTHIFISGRMISGISGSEIFLPSGTYNVQISDYPGSYSSMQGFISGVIYDIVP